MKYAALIVAALSMAGCATPPPRTVAVACPAATDVPDPPARTVATSPRKPGEVVRKTIINRAQWIAHADELTARLQKCKP